MDSDRADGERQHEGDEPQHEGDGEGRTASDGVPCVRVPREAGERTRRALAEVDLLAEDFEISVEDGWLYLPVSESELEAVRDRLEEVLDLEDDGDSPFASGDECKYEYELVARAAPERETQTTPADLLGFDPSYERIGDVALLDEDDEQRALEIARAILESDLPIETVLDKASKVKGETRVREWNVIAGGHSSNPTAVVHREYGCEFALDLAEVYFSPRLATERHRVAEQIGSEALRASEHASGQRLRAESERAFDMFAGVGPFVIPFAKRGAECVGCDINERAIEYLRENARRNGVEDRVTAVCGDVRDVVAGGYEDWADRIVMNLPHSADEFLETAVTLAGDDCLVHYYDIQHEDDPFGPGERAIREAAEPAYDVTVETRHTVRSYAPHELNVCLDVRLERR